MKKLVYGLMLMLVIVLGHEGVAAATLDDPSSFFGLEGELLSETEMEGIVGGLPRMCHDLSYDAIEDGCINNKGQPYLKAKNDCDIWPERLLKEKGIDISDKWGPAESTTVAGHRERVKNELNNTQPNGWSIMIINSDHVALSRLNNDGSIDIFHQGLNFNTDMTTTWESRGYHYKNRSQMRWKGTIEYWDFQ